MLSELDKISEINESSIILYARLWQLEKWLREMVYVELKTKKGINWFKFDDTKKTYEADKAFKHIPTPDENPLSYINFSDLLKLIKNNWDLFLGYLPPQDNWEVKMDEIVHIRNRAAHFRKGHLDDIERLLQLMRDIDKGFWQFCTDYNDLHPILPPDKDIVAMKYVDLNPFSFKEIAPNEWAQIGSAPQGLRYILSINLIKRWWANKLEVIEKTPGYIYDVQIYLRNNQQFDYGDFLEFFSKFKREILHICLDTFSSNIRVTIPVVIGSKRACEIIDELIKYAENSMSVQHSINCDDQSVQRLSEKWPEYILGPKNPLTFLGPGMPCSFFNVANGS
ncbi:hypothetical protein Nit79A3_1472 [Nitrosomonas sp. Is79A3]|uniref:Swt1 family HEPN domain-containing protein n=1 Tax=Nitrosomonas sp. (strain Is79A3) TaxID=261292 RepID=UPI000215D0DE